MRETIEGIQLHLPKLLLCQNTAARYLYVVSDRSLAVRYRWLEVSYKTNLITMENKGEGMLDEGAAEEG